jgi:hypothetical protein
MKTGIRTVDKEIALPTLNQISPLARKKVS